MPHFDQQIKNESNKKELEDSVENLPGSIIQEGEMEMDQKDLDCSEKHDIASNSENIELLQVEKGLDQNKKQKKKQDSFSNENVTLNEDMDCGKMVDNSIHKILMCIECEDTSAYLKCLDCDDLFCELCYGAQHRKGRRMAHQTNRLLQSHSMPNMKKNANLSQDIQPKTDSLEISNEDSSDRNTQEKTSVDTEDENIFYSETQLNSHHFVERAKYIPLRLTEEERRLFILLDASLSVSEYTDKVDVLSYSSLHKRIIRELREIMSIMCGMIVVSDFRKGRKLVENKNFRDNEAFLSKVFEIGRRFKIMNPEKMRDNYGKMIYLLQDSCLKEIQKLLGFSCIQSIQTVYSFIKQKDGLKILMDPRMHLATMEITMDSNKTREAIHRELERKRIALEKLCEDYSSETLSSADIKWCIESIRDNNSYLASNQGPIDKMISFLKLYFTEDRVTDDGFSLAIQAGVKGSRLSHSHQDQYKYALQSLALWRNITKDMFKLWFLTESDLLGGGTYRLRDTGQGLNRVQRAPNTTQGIHRILSSTQQDCRSWVGSSVVHLGDHNVPNALMFIDKYTQISRILSPIVRTIDEIDRLATDPNLQSYLETFGTATFLKKTILADFFKHGFDGSGATNFFDAGSCIDGRLTSAWNWCSKIEKKSYYHIFLLAGFVGFDGSFEKH